MLAATLVVKTRKPTTKFPIIRAVVGVSWLSAGWTWAPIGASGGVHAPAAVPELSGLNAV